MEGVCVLLMELSIVDLYCLRTAGRKTRPGSYRKAASGRYHQPRNQGYPELVSLFRPGCETMRSAGLSAFVGHQPRKPVIIKTAMRYDIEWARGEYDVDKLVWSRQTKQQINNNNNNIALSLLPGSFDMVNFEPSYHAIGESGRVNDEHLQIKFQRNSI